MIRVRYIRRLYSNSCARREHPWRASSFMGVCLMPYAAQKPCSRSGCRALTDGGLCEVHRRASMKTFDATRGNSGARGYGVKWRKARLTYLNSHPLCVACLKQDRVVAATEVDHIVPHRGDMRAFWKSGNWQSLCKSCHSSKTAREGNKFRGYPRLA